MTTSILIVLTSATLSLIGFIFAIIYLLKINKNNDTLYHYNTYDKEIRNLILNSLLKTNKQNTYNNVIKIFNNVNNEYYEYVKEFIIRHPTKDLNDFKLSNDYEENILTIIHNKQMFNYDELSKTVANELINDVIKDNKLIWDISTKKYLK